MCQPILTTSECHHPDILCPGAVPFQHGQLVSTCPLFTGEVIGLAKIAAITREVQWDCGHFVHLVFGDAAHLMGF